MNFTSHRKKILFGKDTQVEFLQKTPFANCDKLSVFNFFFGTRDLWS